MEASAVISSLFPSTTPPLDPDDMSLALLSKDLGCLLDPRFLDRADADIVLAAGEGAVVVGAYSCILAARSLVLRRHISSLPASEKPRLELAALVPGGCYVGRDALKAVLGYMYTGVFDPPVQPCADTTCRHGACPPAIDLVVGCTYAACGFQIPALASLCQRRLFDLIDMAYDEDIISIIRVASTCKLSDLLNRCIQKVAILALDNYFEKQLPGDIYGNIERCFPSIDEYELFIRGGPELQKTVKRIHKAMDSDNIGLVGRILKESSITMDDAFAIHYAAACCTPEMLAELLKLNSANVNLINFSGYTPLHMACTRLEPDIILSLVEKGASVLHETPDGRDALTICKRLARKEDFSRKLEKGQKRSDACLCIDILEKAMEKAKEKSFISDQASVNNTVFAALLADNLHMSLDYLEIRVDFAELFFPSQVKVAMWTAEAVATEESTTRSKLEEVGLNVTPTANNRGLLKRLYVLMKTVAIGRQYFPSCSDIIDKFLEKEAIHLALSRSDDPEDQQLKRTRLIEIRKEAQEAFNKDMAAGATIRSAPSTSASPRSETLIPGISSSESVRATTDPANAAAPLASGLSGSAAGPLESQGRNLQSCAGFKPKLKSRVWNEFKRVKKGGDWKGECQWCKNLLSASTKNGTNHLRRHLDSCQARKATKGTCKSNLKR